jgi:hypothetical protein
MADRDLSGQMFDEFLLLEGSGAGATPLCIALTNRRSGGT